MHMRCKHRPAAGKPLAKATSTVRASQMQMVRASSCPQSCIGTRDASPVLGGCMAH